MNTNGTALHPTALALNNVRQLLLVPEPSTLAMLLAALPLAYVSYRRRRD